MKNDMRDDGLSEEDRAYKRHIDVIRSNVRNGIKFDLACETVTVENAELKQLIIDDALKVEIAELHYGKGLPLLEVSKKLGVPMERLIKANNEMMEDILHSADNAAEAQSGGKEPLTH